MTLETASGTLVPAAKNVNPITESGIFKVSPKKWQGSEICVTDKRSVEFVLLYTDEISQHPSALPSKPWNLDLD